MAKLSLINRDQKRRKLVKKFAKKREALVAIINDSKASEETRFAARLKQFNNELLNQLTVLHGQLSGLGQSWRDREHDKFVEEFEQTMQVMKRFVDSTNGSIVTWVEERWDLSSVMLPQARRDTIASHLAAWEGPESEERPEPSSRSVDMLWRRGQSIPHFMKARIAVGAV